MKEFPKRRFPFMPSKRAKKRRRRIRKPYRVAAAILFILLIPLLWRQMPSSLSYMRDTKPSSANEKSEKDSVCGRLYFDEEEVLPILYTENPEYALCHNMQGQMDSMGSIFTETMPRSVCNLVVYGHSSKWRTGQFTFLKRYAEADYYQAHPYILLEDDRGTRRYRIVSFSRYDLQADETYMGWCEADFENDDAAAMFQATKMYHLRETQGIIYRGEDILTLVTCDMDAENARFVLQAVCVGDDG